MTTPQATLPVELETPTVGSMAVGDRGYTFDQELWVDAERRCWLNRTGRTFPQPYGLATMLIERRADGYHVTASPKWPWRVGVPNDWDPSVLVPVVSIEVSPPDPIPEPAPPRRRWWQR